jgi:hypothetical protein
MVLPNPIVVDLFDIEYKPSQSAIDYISDIIENHGFVVDNVNDYDIRIWFNFTLKKNNLNGNLIVDRMKRSYEISAKTGDISYASLATKNFDLVEEWLKLLHDDLSR